MILRGKPFHLLALHPTFFLPLSPSAFPPSLSFTNITHEMKPPHILHYAVLLAATARAGPAAYATCQAACAKSLVAGAAGIAIYAACQAACAPLLIMPCP